VNDFEVHLVAAGMSLREAQSKVALFAECATALAALHHDRGPMSEPLAFFVPGRIEVLGKHTDYAGGRSLLCAVERGFVVLATPRDDAIICAVAVQRGEERAISLDASG
jgi:galactokinase